MTYRETQAYLESLVHLDVLGQLPRVQYRHFPYLMVAEGRDSFHTPHKEICWKALR